MPCHKFQKQTPDANNWQNQIRTNTWNKNKKKFKKIKDVVFFHIFFLAIPSNTWCAHTQTLLSHLLSLKAPKFVNPRLNYNFHNLSKLHQATEFHNPNIEKKTMHLSDLNGPTITAATIQHTH